MVAKLPEALFVIDDQQQIVHWSNAAVEFLGVSEEAALGRPCHEVVRGRDPFGGAVCRPDCATFKAIRSGQLTASCSLRLPWLESSGNTFLAELVALPESSGGAVAILSERQAGSPTSISPNSATGLLRDLAALATLSTSMSPDDLEKSMDSALGFLRQATGAEVAELFLREPQGGDMLLTAHSGPFNAAFSQITRFQPGEGFPGLVEIQKAPIATQDLAEDSRYLRTRVTGKGFQSYVGVPLLGASGVTGVLSVAARQADFDIDRALRLLNWASHPISAVLQAGLLQVRETLSAGPGEFLTGTERDLDAFLRAVLHEMMLVGQATGGALLLYDRSGQGVVRRVTGGEFTGGVCPDIREGNPQECPVLLGGHGVALHGPRRQWPSPCRRVPTGEGMVYCLPLMAGKEAIGIVQLRYGGHGPSPPTKYLPVLLNLAERAAEAIGRAWTNLPREQLPLSGRAAEGARRLAVAEGEASLQQATQEADGPDDRPFLEIRCFGAFELYRQGRLVTPDMFDRRKALTLLKILLIHDGQAMRGETLAEFLWPETDPKTAMNRLYVLVHTLRRVIEPPTEGQHWTFICSDGGRYYFNSEAPYRLDVREFREYANLSERLERDGDVTAAIETCEAAVNVYRGNLLEDEPYAEWCGEEREYLREKCLAVLGKLTTYYLQQDEPAKSVERCRQALRIAPLREGTHRQLMRSLWLAGRRDEALREYRVLKDLLRRELDVNPLPETEELYSLIRNDGER